MQLLQKLLKTGLKKKKNLLHKTIRKIRLNYFSWATSSVKKLKLALSYLIQFFNWLFVIQVEFFFLEGVKSD